MSNKIWQSGTLNHDNTILTLPSRLYALELVIDKAYELVPTTIKEVHFTGKKGKVIISVMDLVILKRKQIGSKKQG